MRKSPVGVSVYQHSRVVANGRSPNAGKSACRKGRRARSAAAGMGLHRGAGMEAVISSLILPGVLIVRVVGLA